MNDAQMELGLGNNRSCPSAVRRQRHVHRAQWWFRRMREVVDHACDWSPTPQPRPEQIWFSSRALRSAPRRAEVYGMRARTQEHEIAA